MLNDGNNNSEFGLTPNSDIKQCLLEIDKKPLVSALSHMQSVVEKRNIIPILSNILIVAKDNQIALSATDMDILLSEIISTTILQEFAITLNAQLFYDIIRKLDGQHKIKFNLIDNNTAYINISCGNSSFNLPTIPASEFPKFGDIKYTSNFKISATELKKMIDECKFAMADEEIRYNLSGIYIHYYDSSIRLVATDGHRLAVATSNKIANLQEFQGIIIPKKAILELRKIIDELSEDIELHLATNKILYVGRQFTLISKLIDAKFPDYDGLIPKDNNIKIQLKTDLFLNAVDRVATITNEKFRGIKFILNKTSLFIMARDDIGNKAEEILNVNTDYTGQLELGFNFKYILDVLHVTKGNTVICSFKNPFAPAAIEDPSNKNFQYIVMPRRV